MMAAVIAIAVSAGVISGFPGGGHSPLLVGFSAAALLSMPFWLFCIALMNAATTRAELSGDISKAFNLRAIWAYAGKTWKQALVTTILMAFIGFGLLLLGMIACVIGMFVSVAILYIAGLHVRWQIYNEYLLEGGKPVELAPWETLPAGGMPGAGDARMDGIVGPRLGEEEDPKNSLARLGDVGRCRARSLGGQLVSCRTL